MAKPERGNRDHEKNTEGRGSPVSQPNLSAVKVIARDVAKGNMSASSLASCIIILVDEIKEIKRKVKAKEYKP